MNDADKAGQAPRLPRKHLTTDYADDTDLVAAAIVAAGHAASCRAVQNADAGCVGTGRLEARRHNAASGRLPYFSLCSQ
jgi:hypothetical protein